MDELIAFFQRTKMFYIATIEDGRPRVRPFGNLMNIDGTFYINTGRNKRFFAQVQENPYVEICMFDKGLWYRLEGKTIECHEESIRQRIMTEDPFVRRQYAQCPQELVILGLSEVKAYRCQLGRSVCVYES